MRGVGGGVGGPPLRDHLWQGPPLPVTLRLIHPPPKMTQGVMTPPSSPFNSILERGRKSVRISSLFSLFSFAIFFDSSKRIFPDSGVPYPLVSTVGFAIFAIRLCAVSVIAPSPHGDEPIPPPCEPTRTRRRTLRPAYDLASKKTNGASVDALIARAETGLHGLRAA